MTAGAEARVVLADEVILDFGGLFSVIEGEKQASKKPVEPLLDAGQYESSTEQEKPVEGLKTAQNGHTEIAPAVALLRKAEQAEADRKRSLEVYKTYQDNIRKAGSLRTSIIKGVRAGEDVYSLFLQAAKAISLMTSDTLFFDQIEADIKAIYGKGLGEKPPLQTERDEVAERLRRLLEAEEREQEPDSKRRIQAAIKAHRNRITELEELISRAS